MLKCKNCCRQFNCPHEGTPCYKMMPEADMSLEDHCELAWFRLKYLAFPWEIKKEITS